MRIEKRTMKAATFSTPFTAKKKALIVGARSEAETLVKDGQAYM